MVLGWLDVCVLALVAVEPRLHAEVWLSAPLVQLVPRLVSRQAVAQYSLKRAAGGDVLRRGSGNNEIDSERDGLSAGAPQ